MYEFPSEVVMTETIVRSRDELTGDRVINQYVIGTRLGQGQHGEVYMGFDVTNNYMPVVRVSSLSSQSLSLNAILTSI